MPSLVYRAATVDDADVLKSLIRELAKHEDMLEKFDLTHGDMRQTFFDPQTKVFAVLAEVDGKAAGFVIYYYTYSTFSGQMGIHLEDLYVKPEFRRHGVGRGFFQNLAQKAVAENCYGVEWSVRVNNQRAIEFYQSLGASHDPAWQVMAIDGDAMAALAKDHRTQSDYVTRSKAFV